MRIKFYSQAEMAKLHPPGQSITFGGGRTCMPPESAAVLAYGLVTLNRASGSYRRVQLTAVDERMLIDEALARVRGEADLADRDRPAPWSSGRTPYPRS